MYYTKCMHRYNVCLSFHVYAMCIYIMDICHQRFVLY